MTTFLLLITALTLLVRGCFHLTDFLFATYDFVRAHFRPRGVTSLDRREVITRPMVLIVTRSRITPVDNAMIDA